MRRYLMASAALAALTFLPTITLAQEGTVVDEIVVTAQKRYESLLDVPISITAVGAEKLEAAGAKNLVEMQGRVPGVYFSSGAGGAAPIGIRGTAGSATPLSDEPVAVYVDGVYMGRNGGFAASDLLDVKAVEIVRGPQGTLQGRNATAGAILVRSADPKSEFGGFIKGSYADPAELRLQAALTGPLTDGLAGRIALSHTDEKGWATNTFDGSRLGGGRSTQVRGVLLWTPTDSLTIRTSADYSNARATPAVVRWAQTPINPSPGGPLYTVPTPDTPLSPAARRAIEEDNRFALNRPNNTSSEGWGISNEATVSAPGVDLVSVTGWRKPDAKANADSDGLALTGREGFNYVTTGIEQVSQELRLQSTGDAPFSWILGAYAYREDHYFNIDLVNLFFNAPGRTRTHFASNLQTTSYASFADGTWKVHDKWAFSAGLRYTFEERLFTLDRRTFLFDSGTPVSPLFQHRPKAESWTDVSYRAKAVYTPTDDLMLYASYSKGFKSGGFNAFGTEPAYNPETLLSAELGAKLRLPAVRGYVAASAYSNKYENLQLRAGIPTGGMAIFNAASSTIKGFEVEALIQPLEGLTLEGNVAHTDATFDDFKSARDVQDRPVDASGNHLPRTPEWQYFLGAAYQRALTEDIEARAEVTYSWRDTIYLYQTNQNSESWRGEPLSDIGARLTFTHLPADVKLGVFGRNLTNERSVSNVSISFAYPVVSFNKPRVIGVFLEKKF